MGKITNSTYIQAFLYDLTQGKFGNNNDLDTVPFDRLDLSTTPYLEKHLEFLCSWTDDLITEQQKFQYFSRSIARSGGGSSSNKSNSKKNSEELQAAWSAHEAPRRIESLLISNQIRSYCDQMNEFASGGMGKLLMIHGSADAVSDATEVDAA